jgi:hypothetical protein
VRATALLALVLLAGCAHAVHEVHTSDFTPGAQITSGRIVKAAKEQFVVMGIVGQTDYVNEAYEALMDQCKSGSITGITTQYSTSLGFFSWTHKILMQGLCLQPRS